MMIFKGRNRVTSGFRLAARPSHNGIDLVGDDDKTVHAVAGGTVGFAGVVSKSACGLTWQWGYYVRIDGNDGRKYYYCHLAAGSLLVRAGQRVQAGTALGTMGNTGYSFGAHTHFEVRNAYGTPIDPASYAGVRNAVGTYADTTDKEDSDMKFLKVTSGKCEVFTAPDVNAVDKLYNGGKLTEGVCYPVQAEVGSSGGYSWVRIFVAGVQRYAAVLADRCQLVTLSPGDAFTACVAQGGGTSDAAEGLKAQLEAANARADAEARRADEADKRAAEETQRADRAQAGETKANEQAGEYLRRIESAKAALGGAV
ncbi:M23 family metallopeptidase [Ruthenibacterium lactatiformans]|uniref:M23 family metallopeptidase n=1 Tax=Ruthenibacterium lactatiformans TaxID=1550024 RepID=UPI00267219B4|nr:M23 family metallopeptidase [Ruthenibacterium lactatiformans]